MSSERHHGKVVKMECNIDDCTGEVLGYCMERLMDAGALDVSYMPIFMKKNRPAYMMIVICKPYDREKMEDIIFAETTTIGIRYVEMERTFLQRAQEIYETSLGPVKVKQIYNGDTLRLAPEYEDIKAIAKAKNMPYLEVLQTVEAEL